MWRYFLILATIAILTGSSGLGCLEYGPGEVKVIPKRLTFLVSSNTVTNFTPCGCHSQTGGMPRRGTIFKNVDAETPWPLMLVDTGNVSQGSTSEVQATKDMYIFQSYEILDYDFVNLGINDLRLGQENLLQAGEEYGIPWTSSNIFEEGALDPLPFDPQDPMGTGGTSSSTDPVGTSNATGAGDNPTDDGAVPEPPDSEPVFEPYRIVNHEGYKIAFIGAMVHDAPRLNQTPNFSFEAYTDSIRRTVDILRNDEKVDLIVLVCDADTLDGVNTEVAFAGTDIVFGGRTNRQQSPNARANPTNPFYSPPNPNQRNPASDINPNQPGDAQEGAEGTEDSEERVILDPLETPLLFPKAMNRGRAVWRVDIWLDETGNIVDYFTREIHVDDNQEDDPRLAEVARGYDTDVHSDELLRQVRRQFSGSVACDTCHPGFMDAWSSHGHFHAYETIEEADELGDRSCTECHAIGFIDEPRLLTYDLIPETHRNVGCEGCHPNGQSHINHQTHLARLDSADRSSVTTVDPISSEVARSTCMECHTGERGRMDIEAVIEEARAMCQSISPSALTLDQIKQQLESEQP